jgi:hypothetical protein
VAAICPYPGPKQRNDRYHPVSLTDSRRSARSLQLNQVEPACGTTMLRHRPRPALNLQEPLLMTKPPTAAESAAASASTKDGQKVTRETTRTRGEVRENTIPQKKNPRNDGGGRTTK